MTHAPSERRDSELSIDVLIAKIGPQIGRFHAHNAMPRFAGTNLIWLPPSNLNLGLASIKKVSVACLKTAYLWTDFGDQDIN